MGSRVRLQRLYRRRCEGFPPSVEVDCPNRGATGCPEGDWGEVSAETVDSKDDGRKEEDGKAHLSTIKILYRKSG